MARQSNGRAKGPGQSTPNGKLNGSLNGHADKPKITGAQARSNSTSKPGRTWTGSFFNLLARLTSWYLIATILFRCPSSLVNLSETSPKVCKPYLHARSYAAPHLDPLYQTYVAPQVDKVKPYVNTIDQRVYTPASTFAKKQYATYGAHRVEQAQKYVEAEWARTARPQIQNIQDKVYAQYEQHLGPYVESATDAAGPYVEKTKDSLVEIYHLSLLPAYEIVLPYAHQAYVQGHLVTTRYIYPGVQSGKDATWKFVSRTVWPYVRVLYGDNVEPQLVRIGERLGRYKDQQKVESAVDAYDSQISSEMSVADKATSSAVSSSSAAASSASSSASISSASSAPVSETTESAKAGWGVLDDFFKGDATQSGDVETKTPTQPKQPQLTGAELQEKLTNDLRNWQTKFAIAADKGAEDLDTRVADITERQIEKGVKGHGAALIVQLEETAENTVASLKKFILKTVEALPEDASDEQLEQALEKCTAKTRELGLSVKEKAQAVREWKVTFDATTDGLVRAAVASTVEVLDKIHGLGLQEVGMRWAWTDGVEYEDWQNYHKLRHTLTEWQAEVEAVGAKHDGLRLAHEEAAQLEEKAMTIASSMVSELVRLKDVAKWKIWAEDATDDFSDKKVPARAAKVAQQVKENVEELSSKASEAILGSETPASESIASAVSESASSASSVASESASAASSKISEAASSVSSKVSESVVGSETPVVESAASVVKESASQVSSKVSEAVLGSETPAAESLASKVKSEVSKASSQASDAASQAASDVAEKIETATEAVEEKYEQVSSAASSVASEAPKKVWGGANAQVIAEAKQIIFDDVIEDDEDETYSEKLQHMVADAGDHATDLSRAVSEALFGATKTQGNVESATSIASEQYAKALAAASSVLYGTEQAPLESVSSLASEKYAQAVTAASHAVYGTPAPTAVYQTVRTHASSRYNAALSVANEQFENAKSQLSLLASGTVKPAHETMLSMFEKAYSDSVAAASERLVVALQYTDSIKSYAAGPTQGYFESVSSIASSRLSEGLSHATAQFTAQPTPAIDGARRQYYEAIGLAHARYSDFLAAASSAVYGAEQGTAASLASVASASAASIASQASEGVIGSETPWAQSVASEVADSAQSAIHNVQDAAEAVASQASVNWDALIAQASNQVYGAPTPWAEAAYSNAGVYAAQATEQAAEKAAAIQALLSELVVGQQPDFTQSVMLRFSSAYYTGLPAAVASASSLAAGGYDAISSVAADEFDAVTSLASDAYASASSVVEQVFTPPAAVETILAQVTQQLEDAVASASVAVYGTQKGQLELASAGFKDVAASAQAAISEAVFGPPEPTGYAAAVSSVASEKAAQAAAAVSEAVYGKEQGAVESARSRLAAAVEAANSRVAEVYAEAAKSAEAVASGASSVAAEATGWVKKDEL